MQEHHISSVGLLASVAGALLFLTFITIAVTWFDIPAPWNIVVAIGIAAIKASLVALFFMNLWWDSKFNLMLLVLGLMFLGFLVGLTLVDTLLREVIFPVICGYRWVS